VKKRLHHESSLNRSEPPHERVLAVRLDRRKLRARSPDLDLVGDSDDTGQLGDVTVRPLALELVVHLAGEREPAM